MRQLLLMLAALAATAVLQGCANVSPAATAQAQSDDGFDHARIGGIERAARVRGVSVIWINPPRKPS